MPPKTIRELYDLLVSLPEDRRYNKVIEYSEDKNKLTFFSSSFQGLRKYDLEEYKDTYMLTNTLLREGTSVQFTAPLELWVEQILKRIFFVPTDYFDLLQKEIERTEKEKTKQKEQ